MPRPDAIDGDDGGKAPEGAAPARRRGYSLQLCWHRIHFLRAFVLRAFGADVQGPIGVRGSAWVECSWDLRVGAYSSIGPRVTLYNLAPLAIGANTVIGRVGEDRMSRA